MKQHQVVTGTALNILAVGICAFFQRVIFGVPTTPLTVRPLPSLPVPLLSKIPWIGPILFDQNILTYGIYLLLPISAFILYRTSWGLTIRSTGEKSGSGRRRGDQRQPRPFPDGAAVGRHGRDRRLVLFDRLPGHVRG